MRAKLQALEGVRGFQISEETKKTMREGATRNVTAVMGLQITYAMKSATAPAFKAKLDKLTSNYQALLKL